MMPHINHSTPRVLWRFVWERTLRDAEKRLSLESIPFECRPAG